MDLTLEFSIYALLIIVAGAILNYFDKKFNNKKV